MNVEIISVGTELLLGDIVNTNAQYLSKELAVLGINVYKQSTVGDNDNRLSQAFGDALKRADVVITTGGLGPTADDLTKETAAKYFGKKLVMHGESLEKIEKHFSRLGYKMTDNNRKQAMMPEDSLILANFKGTAPGCIVENGEKAIIMLPGPPFEVVDMFEQSVKPWLMRKTGSILFSRTLRICGIGESAVEDRLLDILETQTNPTIAPYAKSNEVTLRITAKAENEEKARDIIEPLSKEIYNRLGEYIYGEGENTLESVVTELIRKNKLTIAVAESCTGGLLAGRITSVPGVSDIFLEGAVTYSNQAKIKRLGVKAKTLEKYGAVSFETAGEMAEGIAETSGADVGVSITGIAGPTGDTETKPVGLVYIGLCIKGRETAVKEILLAGDRERIRNRAITNALDFIRKSLSNMERIKSLNSSFGQSTFLPSGKKVIPPNNSI